MSGDRNSCVWVGTEDYGVWRYDPTAKDGKLWTEFNAANGLGDDNCYAILCDRLGRVWLGTLNHGVSVYYHNQWRNYGPLNGPLGERIFALAASPIDGSIWIATSAGLTRYSIAHDTWTYFTRADGLPSDQATCLAFGQDGTLYVGTNCDGIAIAHPADNYSTWKRVQGPYNPPNAAAGSGLPSNLINALLVGHDGTVWAGTSCGLAHSRDQGKTWRYKRGKDWADKIRGLWSGPELNPVQGSNLLSEDYVSCLTQDKRGLIYIGYRQNSFEVLNPVTGRQEAPSTPDPDHGLYMSALMPVSNGMVFLGRYGSGVRQGTSVAIPTSLMTTAQRSRIKPAKASEVIAATSDGFPSPAHPLHRADQVAALSAYLANPGPRLKPGGAYFEHEDWTTEGDWEGRYGHGFALLCAAGAPIDHQITGDFSYYVRGSLGPHINPPDGLRHWIHWSDTQSEKCLWDPAVGHRRQSEFDDHGEEYPNSFEGPDVFVTVKVPSGTHRVSLYFMNKDSHTGVNSYRDYLVEVKPHKETLGEAMQAPALARARVRSFWGGVYESFIVAGPAIYDIRIGKNNSFNTILSGVFLDRLQGTPDSAKLIRDPWLSSLAYDPAPMPTAAEIEAENSPRLLKTSINLWTKLDSLWDRPHLASLQYRFRLQTYRAIEAKQMSPALLENWRWQIDLWTPDDRQAFNTATKSQWAMVIANNPDIADVQGR
jgi:hypothetical protein